APARRFRPENRSCESLLALSVPWRLPFWAQNSLLLAEHLRGKWVGIAGKLTGAALAGDDFHTFVQISTQYLGVHAVTVADADADRADITVCVHDPRCGSFAGTFFLRLGFFFDVGIVRVAISRACFALLSLAAHECRFGVGGDLLC